MDRYIVAHVDSVITGVQDFYVVVDIDPNATPEVIARGDIATMAALRDALNGA